MSLQKKAWSVSALSVELSIDRRTLCKRLDSAGVQPINSKRPPTYRLKDVLPALASREPETQAAGQEEADWTPEWGYSNQILDVRSAFIFAEPVALVMIKNTDLSPQQALDIIPTLWLAFQAQASAILGKNKILRKLPLDMRGKDRGVLLAKLQAERTKGNPHG